MTCILGISCEHDSGASVLRDDGMVLAAVNEERFTREKLYTGFPRESILSALECAGVRPADVSGIGLASLMHVNISDWDWDAFSPKRDMVSFAMRFAPFKSMLEARWLRERLVRIARADAFHDHVRQSLADMGFAASVEVIDHHDCHVRGAIHTCGFESGLAVSFDAFGDGYSSKSYSFSDHGRKTTLITSNPFFKSMAHYYGYATKILGFRQMEHEGKVTGLSAHGDPERAFRVFQSRLFFDETAGRFRHLGHYIRPELGYLRKALADMSPEDIAAGVQMHLEVNAVAYVKHLLRLAPSKRLTLAGGIFANVLLNQKLAEIEGIEDIHIHPNMGDGGLGLGAAAILAARGASYRNQRITNVFWGPASPPDQLDAIAARYPVKERIASDPELECAQALAAGKVVGFVEGRMEYGPRALCHRTILVGASDTTVNDWLNKKLRRTEFMPFAPILLASFAEEYLDNIGSKRAAMDFMTTTCSTKPVFRQQAPAANHVDNTARPQLITAATGRVFQVLTAYHGLTGCPVLINTSFNLHGEPIVSSHEDAIRSFLDGELDLLYLDGRVFERA